MMIKNPFIFILAISLMAALPNGAFAVAEIAEGIHAKTDINYAEPAHPLQKLDVYAPAGATNLPVIVWIHGGGYEKGDKSNLKTRGPILAGKGYVFVSVNYRLAPEVGLDAMMRDVAAAIGWVYRNIGTHGGDPQRIFIMGHSAGAQMAALVCTAERFLQAEGVPFAALKGCIPLDTSSYDLPSLFAGLQQKVGPDGKPDPEVAEVSSFFGETPELRRLNSATLQAGYGRNIPPFLIVYAKTNPSTTRQSDLLCKQLNRVGVPSWTHGVPKVGHIELAVNIGKPGDESTRVILAFMDRALAMTPQERPIQVNLWPGVPPGDEKMKPLGEEHDRNKETDRKIVDWPIIRLTDVSLPQLMVHRPAPGKETGTAVVICPGGGYNMLAYDLEGYEVAEWLNSIGVTAVVLKYRVPHREGVPEWFAADQDAERAMSMVRSRAAEWGIKPDRIGLMGFSAGGVTTAHVALNMTQRHYQAVDAVDRVSFHPDFAMLIYPGGLVGADGQLKLPEGIAVTDQAPPLFFAHAFDDRASVQSSLLLASALKRAGGSAEVHVYDAGGHGYGLRPDPALPVTTWPTRAEEWLRRRGLLAR